MKGGVAIRNRNKMVGDIIEKLEGDNVKEESYKVRIRGSQSTASQKGDGDEVIIAKKSDLIQLLGHRKAGATGTRELLRDGLIKAKRKNPCRQDLRKRWLAICIDDEIGYLIDCHTNPKSLDGMPQNIENQVLARVVASYYLGDGTIACSGRTLTSYVRTLSPFMQVDDNGIAMIGFHGTSGSIIEEFKSLITRDPSRAGALLVRAFAFSLYRMDNWQEGNGDSLIDAFCIAISAIHLIDGNELPEFNNSHSIILSSIDSFFYQHGVDLYEKLHCNGIHSSCAPGARFNSNHLIWCLCMHLLSIYRIVKDHFLSSNNESEYERLLPVPFGTTTTEVQRVMNLAIKYRGQSPATYLRVYTATMHEYDIRHSESPSSLLGNAHRAIQIGGKFARLSADPFYQYNFEMHQLLWTPTHFTNRNDMMSYNQVKERIKKANVEWKQPCLEYIPEYQFLNSENSIVSLKGYAKTFIDKGLPADNKIPCCPNIQLYFVGRFGENRYFRPGGKFDSLSNKYRCTYCSCQLIKALRCERCKAAYYCGKDCQRKHWKSEHKRECMPCKKNKNYLSNEGDPLVGDPIPIADRPSSNTKRYLFGSTVALCFLGVGLYSQRYGTTDTSKNRQLFFFGGTNKVAGSFCRTSNEDSCGADLVCCPSGLTGIFGKCQSCCTNNDCVTRIEQPPPSPGEYGKPYCVENMC